MLVLTYSGNYVKGYWRKKKWELPIHGFYETYKEKCPLYFNLLTFFLPLASADRAFSDYQSMDEILDSVKVGTCNELEEKEIITIFFKKDVLDVPIFRPWDEQAIEDSTGRARGADAFGKELLLNIISRPNK
jgi:carbonic anhydrase